MLNGQQNKNHQKKPGKPKTIKKADNFHERLKQPFEEGKEFKKVNLVPREK